MDARNVSLLACASLLAACSPAVEAQVGATVPPSIPAAPAAPQSERANPTPTPTLSPASAPRPAPTASNADTTERPLPDIFYKEPRDPIRAYRNLIARGNYIRGQARLIPTHLVYVPDTQIYKFHRADDIKNIRKGLRVVDGRTKFEVTLLSRGANQAVIEVEDRDIGWRVVDANGATVKRLDDTDGHYVVWLRRLRQGWRIERIVLADS